MTKVYIAKPAAMPTPPATSPQNYSIDPEAMAGMAKNRDIIEPLKFPIMGKGKYAPDAGFEFNFELNILDTASKQPIRAVEVISGDHKKFTDRLGRVVFRLNRGFNKVVISGLGYLEKGSNFAPQATTFAPIMLDVDLDSDAVYTVYSTGEVIPGERRILDNPGHSSGDLEAFLKSYWWVLGTVGIAGVGMYYLGKSKK